MIAYERVTSTDHTGIARTRDLMITGEDDMWIFGTRVNRAGTITSPETREVIMAETIDKREPLEVDERSGRLRRAGANR